MYGEEKTSGLSTRPTEPSRILMGLQEAQGAVSQLFDKLQPFIAYKSADKEPQLDKIQSSALTELELLNKRLIELLRNIDI